MEHDTKSKILDSAKKLFVKKGFDGTSVKDICDLANVNISALNYHFNSKISLFERIVADLQQSVLAVSDILDTELGSLEECKLRIKLFYENMFKAREHNHDNFLIIIKNIRHIVDKLDKKKEFVFILLERMKKFLEKARDNKYIRQDIDTTYIARILISSVMSECDNAILLNDKSIYNKESRQEYIDIVVDIIFNGISMKPESAVK